MELVRFELDSFEIDDHGVATLLGLELARLVVDTSYPELVGMQRDIEQRGNKQPYRR